MRVAFLLVSDFLLIYFNITFIFLFLAPSPSAAPRLTFPFQVSPGLSLLLFMAAAPFFLAYTWVIFPPSRLPLLFCPPRRCWTALVAVSPCTRVSVYVLFAYAFQPFQSRWRAILTCGLGRMADTCRPFHCAEKQTLTKKKRKKVRELS